MAVAIVGLGAATFAIWLTFPAPIWLDIVAALVMAAWARDCIRLHATRHAGRAAIELMLSSDAVLVVRHRNGRLVAGHARSASFVHPLFTSIVWRADRARFSRSLPIIADMLDPDDFRQLRVLLRYGRREVSAGAPASQA